MGWHQRRYMASADLSRRGTVLSIPALPDDAAARVLLTTASLHLQDVPRLWMDGILPAALTAAGHLRDTDLIHRCQALARAADRDREHKIGNSRRSYP